MVNRQRVADNGCDGTHINGEERLKKERLLKEKYLKSSKRALDTSEVSMVH